jgi:hypothetical membrane protein
VAVKRIPPWAAASAIAAPVVLGTGLALAQWRQPPSYDPVRDTISALAAHGATDRWIMTSALVGLGLSHMVTAAGLRPARFAGRVVLAVGGGATVLVAIFAQPAHGNSVAHTMAATAAFAALALWPLFAASGRATAPLLVPVPSAVAAAVLVALVLSFVAEIHGGHRGLAERAAAGAQALWPLAVVLTGRAAQRASGPT